MENKRIATYSGARAIASITILLSLLSCTIQKQTHVKIIIMAKSKKNYFQSKYNYIPPRGEVNNSPSMTVQGEAYTIQELLEKHAAGIMPPVGLEPQYDEEEPTHDDEMLLRKQDLDLTDIDEIKKKVKATETKKAKIEASKKAKQEAKIKEALEHYDRSSGGEEEAPSNGA